MTEIIPSCVVCRATQENVPLIQLHYQQKTYYICPEHLPLLIHSPQKLVGSLPGAETLKPYNQ